MRVAGFPLQSSYTTAPRLGEVFETPGDYSYVFSWLFIVELGKRVRIWTIYLVVARVHAGIQGGGLMTEEGNAYGQVQARRALVRK